MSLVLNPTLLREADFPSFFGRLRVLSPEALKGNAGRLQADMSSHEFGRIWKTKG